MNNNNITLNNQIKTIYNDINTLEYSLTGNESKANELRKIYEKLFKYLLDYKSTETQHTLYNMINDFLTKENKYSLQYICHSLRKELNSWAHDNPNRLFDETLYDYFQKFRNVVYALTNIEGIKENSIGNFDLSNFNLNNKQKQSVLSHTKITLVNAGPGSGKTYLIVARVLNEINMNNDKKIFALSFTNKASDELQHKIDEKIFSTNLFSFRKNIFTGTIHSFVLETIQEYFKINNRTFDYTVIDEFELKEIKEEFENHDELVEKYLQENQLLTFDKIISMFINTIKNNTNFQEFISKYLNEIIIDEAQDLDKSQYEILSLLDKNIKDLKLFFVGDQRQNIYAFKGGSINNILEFFSDEKDFSHIELEYSYRCPQNTLSFINKFEFNDCKNISLKNALNNNGNELKIEEFESIEDEANWIAKLINNTSNRKSFSDIAIIYSNTFYFKNILESLNAFEIPFKVMGGQYFLNKDIRLIRYILNSIYTNNKFALKNIQNILIKTEFNGENIDEILVPLLDMNIKDKQNYLSLREILKFIKKNSNTDKSILDILHELNVLIESNNLMNKDFIHILFELKEIIQNDLTLDVYEKFKLSFSPMHPKLNVFYSRSDEIVLSEYYDENKEFVTVTTIHSAKGLEWETVIIPGMSQDSFPRYFKYEKDREKEIPNELKKFYVACSRTKGNLYFTRAKYNSWGYKKEKSIFIDKLKKDNKLERDEHLYTYVMEELENDIKDEALWVKAYVISEGCDNKIKPIYVKFRVETIKEKLLKNNLDYNIINKDDIYEFLDESTDNKNISNDNIDALWRWADDNNIDLKKIPRYKNDLLNLKELELSGFEKLPKELGILINLKILNLDSCRLEELPIEICALTNLEELNLANNNLKRLPEEIGNLTNLKILYIYNNRLERLPKEIGKLTNLKTFGASGNGLEVLPKEIGNLTNLSWMNISAKDDCFVRRLKYLPKEIGNLAKLKDLYISNNHLTELPVEIGKLTNLEILALSKNNLIELPEEIGNLTKLTELDFYEQKMRSIPKEIGKLTNLIKLDLRSNQLREIPKEIGNLINLEKFQFERNELNELPEEIGNIKKLETLELEAMSLNKLPKGIGELTNLKKLLIEFNNISKLPKDIAKLAKLDTLILWEEKLEDIPREIGQLSNLKRLSIKGSLIEKLPKEIGDLNNLEDFHISSNYLKEIPKELGNLTKLEELSIWFSKFITEIPEEICNLENLRVLDIQGTNVQKLPNNIHKLKNLQVLKVDNYHNIALNVSQKEWLKQNKIKTDTHRSFWVT